MRIIQSTGDVTQMFSRFLDPPSKSKEFAGVPNQRTDTNRLYRAEQSQLCYSRLSESNARLVMECRTII